MDSSTICSSGGNGALGSPRARLGKAAIVAVLIAFGGGLAVSRAQPAPVDAPGAQVLTRGPVHEAFAAMVTFDPVPGVVVAKAPPENIEEVPPDERPQGDNVTWIPGYWGWDDERNDFIWVSGTWRALPPGRAWMAGYWAQTPAGYQWTSGYWADAAAPKTTYLPPPPVTLEAGPNLVAPSPDYGWTPGCWVWYSGRYAWRPGYWFQGRRDWNWMPDHYVWTPRGCIFVGGFWDYPVERRGVLFAPVYFETALYSRRGYRYAPAIVIDLDVFSEHLFLRPRYAHYYFGDYYAPSYLQVGFYASFSFQSGRHGYDPIYAHQRWEHRDDRDWGSRVKTSYENRRDHQDARPPRTWAAQRGGNAAGPGQNHGAIAAPFSQLTSRKDDSRRFQPVARDERQKLSQRGAEVRTSRDARRDLETKAAPAAQRPGSRIEPAAVRRPVSPIVAGPAGHRAGNPDPPRAPRPVPDARTGPRPGTSSPDGRPPAVNQRPLPTNQRGTAPSSPPKPARGDPAPRRPQASGQPAQPQTPAPNSRPTRPSNGPAREANPQIQPRTTARPRPTAGEKGATQLQNHNRPAAKKGNPSEPEKHGR